MRGSIVLLFGLLAALHVAPAQAEDAARKACYADAKRLCADAVRAMSRKRAEACLWQKLDQTSPGCHAMILQVHAQRSAKPAPR